MFMITFKINDSTLESLMLYETIEEAKEQAEKDKNCFLNYFPISEVSYSIDTYKE